MEHTDTSIRGIILLVLNFLEDVCLLFFVAFPFFLRGGGGVITQASFLCSGNRQATKERSEQQKVALRTSRSMLHYSPLSDHMEAASPK